MHVPSRVPGKLFLLALSGGSLAVAAVTSGCRAEQHPGVYLEFRADASEYTPHALKFTWMRAGSELITSRLPEHGFFPTPGPMMGSLFIETSGPLNEHRLIAVRGVRGVYDEEVVSGAVRVVPPSQDRVQRLSVVLGRPLADEDGDGKPDVVERDCLSHDPDSCVDPGDGRPADAGPPPAGDDGGTSPVDARPEIAPDSPPDAGPTLESELLGHWRLDDGMGSEMARDSSGKGNNGTLRGLRPDTAWTMGKIGGGLEIPAADGNCVHVPANVNLDTVKGAFTIAAWTYRTAHRSQWATVLSRRYESTGNEHYTMAFQGGMLRGLLNTHLGGGMAGNLSAPATAPLNSWVHVAFTYDGSTMRLYQNGMTVAVGPQTATVMPDDTPLSIGCGQNSPGDTVADETLSGRLDEVLLYTRALGPAEIARLAAGELPRLP